jgi:hypothetical protein
LKLAKSLQILEADRRLTLLLGLTHFLVAGAHSFFDVSSTALVIAHLGPDALPQVFSGGSMDLWSQEIATDGAPMGQPQPVSVGIEMRHAMFSRDGTKLAYSRGRPVANLFRVPILEERVATWDDAEQVTFEQAFVKHFDMSPDGKRLALSSDRSGNLDLWILTMATGEMIQLTSEPTPDVGPMWSPDGRELVFHSHRSGNREVWVLPLGGGPARQLTEGQGRFRRIVVRVLVPERPRDRFLQKQRRHGGHHRRPGAGRRVSPGSEVRRHRRQLAPHLVSR